MVQDIKSNCEGTSVMWRWIERKWSCQREEDFVSRREWVADFSAAGWEVSSEGTFTDRAHITTIASFKDLEVLFFTDLWRFCLSYFTPFHEQPVFAVCAMIMRQNDVQRVTEVMYLNMG